MAISNVIQNVANQLQNPQSSSSSSTIDFLSNGYEQGLSGDSLNPLPIEDYSIGSDISNWFTGNYDKMKDLYQNYYLNYIMGYNERLDNTRYQRAFKDLEEAGLNPYLLVTGGSASPASGGSASISSDASSNFQSGRAGAFLASLLKLVGASAILGKLIK